MDIKDPCKAGKCILYPSCISNAANPPKCEILCNHIREVIYILLKGCNSIKGQSFQVLKIVDYNTLDKYLNSIFPNTYKLIDRTSVTALYYTYSYQNDLYKEYNNGNKRSL